MKKFLFALALVCMQYVSASNSVAHCYFAERYLEHNSKYTETERKEFMVGTLFPDIRDLDATVHELTHIKDVTIDGVRNAETPFLAGWMLHCLVDDVRTAFQKEWGIFDRLSDFNVQRKGAFLKVVEDALVYDRINRQFVIESLKDIYDGEREIEKSDQIIQKWHDINIGLLSKSQKEILMGFSERGEGFLKYSPEEIQDWNEKFNDALLLEDIDLYFVGLLDRFEEVVQN